MTFQVHGKVSPVVRQIDLMSEHVVEYALNRTLAPALIAQYQTQLPDKKLLHAKLQEFDLQYEQQLEERA